MNSCEMCGKNATLTTTNIAGSSMQLCNNCKRLGSVENQKPSSKSFFKNKKKTQPTKQIVDNYSSVIAKALEEKGYNAHQLARAINLKESSLNKFLTAKLQPDLEIAKKIENFLEITLIEESTQEAPIEDYLVDEEEEQPGNSLGDLIKKQLNNK